MESFRCISSAQFIDKPLDTRRLSFSLRFYQFNQEHVLTIKNRLIQWVSDFAGQGYVFDWLYNGRKLSNKRILERLSRNEDLNHGLRFAYDAYPTSPIIHDSVTLRKYQRFIQSLNPSATFGWRVDPLLGASSVDYPEFITHTFPPAQPNQNELVQLIYRIFCEPNKTCFALHNCADFSGSFEAIPYREHSQSYYGRFIISFSAFSLGDALNDAADAMAGFAQELANQYINVNAFVSLQPPYSEGSPYMRYFGKNMVPDGSHEAACCTEEEWYSTYYMRGVEWLNILSPLTKQHLKSAPLFENGCDSIIVKELTGGGILVGSSDPIMSYDVQTALKLKRILQPALYPGMTSTPIKGLFPKSRMGRIYDWCPRNDWAIIPMEESEISIVGENIVYTALHCDQ